VVHLGREAIEVLHGALEDVLDEIVGIELGSAELAGERAKELAVFAREGVETAPPAQLLEIEDGCARRTFL